MNNPIRAALQRRIEAGRLLRLGGPVRGVALEIGCGQGVGAEIVLDVFGAERVDAFDLDPRMIARAQSRLANRGQRARFWVGDVTRTPMPDETYDAVFDFGIIHHVPEWPHAVAEVARVLKTGGRFYAEEVLRAVICIL
jgi:ubiquinone/menaquinone biosynthesis C-methylase UbiE